MLCGVHQVVEVWNELEGRDYGWKGLPRYAFGVSSGGAMALVLAKYFPLQVSGSASPNGEYLAPSSFSVILLSRGAPYVAICHPGI